ncbi:MAG: pentapeptide repeat-containing protein [Planctomycetia bacterium]|nr:pentapeptide repeat-containing protein [Planctomycetia bacterium]
MRLSRRPTGKGPTSPGRRSRESLAHAVVSKTSFDGADLTGANLHGLDEAAATWKNATLVQARRTDAELLAAERWMPPPVDAAAGA